MLKIIFQIISLPLRIWYYFLLKALSLKKIQFIEIKLEGKMNEAPLISGVVSILKPPQNRFYLKMLELITLDDLLSHKKSKLKKELKEVLIVLHNPKLGWAKAWELNQILKRINQNVKVKVFLESGEPSDYYAALGADEIYTSPAMSLTLMGMEINSLFFSTFLNRLKIKPNFIQIGNYKSAGEKYTRKNFSEYSKKQLTELLKDFHEEIEISLKDSRGERLKNKNLKQLQKYAIITAQKAFDLGLLDGVLYRKDLKSMLEKTYRLKKAKFLDIHQAISKARRKQKKLFPKAQKKKVAFLVGEGMILDSEEPNPKTISYLDYQSALKKMQKSNYDAYIVRWNSPGGSALVSDLLWSELMKLNNQNNLSNDPWLRLSEENKNKLKQQNDEQNKGSDKKHKKKKPTEKAPPIFVSQSDVAASGGYYLSAISRRVYSSPLTLTGSIGVIMGKFNIFGLLKKIGINIGSIQKGEQSNIFSPYSDFSAQQLKLIKANMNSMYDLFADRIHQGRKMPTDTIKKLGGGRVYSGKKAYESGLVDHLGGLKEIFLDLRKTLELQDDDEIVVDFYPRIKAPFFPRYSQLALLMQDLKTIELMMREKILFLFPFF